MDVRCEKCRTLYEFDEEKVTAVGVTVKCSTCGHVFVVKKKSLVVTVPVRPEELAGLTPESLQPATMGVTVLSNNKQSTPPGEVSREWKVRQPGGTLLTFKDLTTLQKWIVERKVSRDDEVSLSGEQWKRLGNIAELASFFQIVETAERVSQPPQQAQNPFAPMAANPSAPPMDSGPMPFPQQSFPPAAYPPPVGQPAPSGPPRPSPRAASAAWEQQHPTTPFGSDVTEPAWTAEKLKMKTRSDPDAEDEDLKAIKRSGGRGVFIAVVLLLLVSAAATFYFRPELVGRAPPAKPPELVALPIPPAPPAPVPAPVPVEVTKPEPPPEPPPEVKAEVKAVPPPKPVEATTPKALLAQAAKMRDRGKAEKALDLYGRVLEQEPENVEALAGRGWCYVDMSAHGPAEQSFLSALQKAPRFEEALIGLAETYRFQGKRAEAVKYYQEYLEHHPDGEDASTAKNAIQQLKE